MSGHKPPDYTTVSPYLIVDGASRTIEFLAAVFDAVELRRFPDADGRLMHAEVRRARPGGSRPAWAEERLRGVRRRFRAGRGQPSSVGSSA